MKKKDKKKKFIVQWKIKKNWTNKKIELSNETDSTTSEIKREKIVLCIRNGKIKSKNETEKTCLYSA